MRSVGRMTFGDLNAGDLIIPGPGRHQYEEDDRSCSLIVGWSFGFVWYFQTTRGGNLHLMKQLPDMKLIEYSYMHIMELP